VSDPAAERLFDAAARRYAPAGRFARHFARGKLRGDPVFAELLRRGLIPDGARLLDLGCGQGCLLALLAAAREQHRAGCWPAGWPPPPAGLALQGIEYLAKDVARANAALGGTATVAIGDLRTVPLPPADVVVLMDVLHYLEPEAQESLLARIAHTLGARGLFVTRVGDPAAGFAAAATWAIDQAVAIARGQGLHRFHRRSIADWIAALERHGFAVTGEPMNGGPLFANVLLLARRAG
jgi:SAM-dependent methyltransferase